MCGEGMHSAQGYIVGSSSNPGPPGKGAWRDRVGMVGVCLCIYENERETEGPLRVGRATGTEQQK